MADGNERRREELRRCLKKLSNDLGVERPNLKTLLGGDLRALRDTWRIDTGNKPRSIKALVVTNLFAQVERVVARTERKRLTEPLAVSRYRNAVGVIFNIIKPLVALDEKGRPKYPVANLPEMILTDRKRWMDAEFSDTYRPDSFCVRMRTAQRYFDDAVEQIVDHLIAPDYRPVIPEEAAAPSVDAPEPLLAPKQPTPERVLQAQTFPDQEAALAGLRQRFDLDSDTPDAAIDHASLAVMHYGGYGQRMQEGAAIRLAQTDAGYFGIAQVHKTVLEMCRALAPALPLVLRISEAAEQARRFDLAISYEQHTEMLSLLRFEEEGSEKYDCYNALIDRAYLDVAMRIGPLGLITAREQCVFNLARALNVGILNARLNYLYSTESAEELGRLTGFVDNLQRLSSSATPTAARILRTRLYEPSEGARRDAEEMIWQHLPNEYVHDGDGSYVVDPLTGERLPVLDVKYHPDIARGYWEQVDPQSLPSNFPIGKDFLGRERRLPGRLE